MNYVWAIFDDEHGVISIWDTKEKAMEEVNNIYVDEYSKPTITETSDAVTYDFDGYKVWIYPEPLNESYGWYE